jgi:hypothetical protein
MVQPSARAGEPASTVQIGKPSFDLGTVMSALIASLSFSMISVGVFVGTPMPKHAHRDSSGALRDFDQAYDRSGSPSHNRSGLRSSALASSMMRLAIIAARAICAAPPRQISHDFCS